MSANQQPSNPPSDSPERELAAPSGYAAALAEIECVKEVLNNLHRRVGTHHSGLGIHNAIQELSDSQAWLRMSMREPHIEKAD